MNASKLANVITKHFNLTEISSLCLALQINFDDLAGDTITKKAQELVAYCQRRGKMDDLISVLQKERPKVNWEMYTSQKEVRQSELFSNNFPINPVDHQKNQQSGLDSVIELLRNIKVLFIALVLINIIGVTTWVWRNFTFDGPDITFDIFSVDWGPNGNTIASSGINDSVILWSGLNSDLILKLEGHTRRIRNVVWSNNGQLLASASDDKSVIIWDFSTGRPIHRLAGHSGPVRDVSWSPDDTRIASSSEDNQVRIWNISTGALEATLTEHEDWVRAVSWSPDGKTLASIGRDKKLIIWDLETMQPKDIKEFPTSLFEVAWNHDGTQLAVATEKGEVVILRTEDLLEEFNLFSHSSAITQVAWSPDNLKIATSSRDGTLIVWDSFTREIIHVFKGHEDTIWNFSWSPDSTKLVSSGHDQNLIVWNVITGQMIRSLKEK